MDKEITAKEMGQISEERTPEQDQLISILKRNQEVAAFNGLTEEKLAELLNED